MSTIKRVYIPGSEWIYLKIYLGHRVADDLLIGPVNKIMCSLARKKIVHKYFFVRYQDPDFHLRIRILVYNRADFDNVIQLFYNVLRVNISKYFIKKVQIDTYVREVERYSVALMEFSESFFYIDSVCLIKIIREIIINKKEEFRWMISLLLIDSLLNEFNLGLDEKYEIMSIISMNFKDEFHIDKFNSKQLSDKYRENRSVIESVLTNSYTDDDFCKLELYSKVRAYKLKELISDYKLDRKLIKNNIHSYIHMSLNRLFMSKNRMHELLIYDFMQRYYKSLISRKQYGG